jgi:hypothetical protein
VGKRGNGERSISRRKNGGWMAVEPAPPPPFISRWFSSSVFYSGLSRSNKRPEAAAVRQQ